MFRCDAIVVILGCYYYDLVSRSVRMSPELDAKIMNSDEKRKKITIFLCRYGNILYFCKVYRRNPIMGASLDTTFGKRHRCFVFGELEPRKFHCWSRTMLMCRTRIDCIYIRSVRRVVPSSTLLDVYYISVWCGHSSSCLLARVFLGPQFENNLYGCPRFSLVVLMKY